MLKPSTLMAFHRALVNRKYRLLFAPRRRKPSPKGPSRELIAAIIEMKRRNPRFGCRRIAQQIAFLFGVEIDKDVVRRVLANHCRPIRGSDGLSWLPKHLSSDHDPLFQFHRWQANLRILEVSEIKTVPYVPLSHPFIERLIGTVRRELLYQVPFWGGRDLEQKLRHCRDYYNHGRVHASLKGIPPGRPTDRAVIALEDYRWQSHCRGLYQLPAAA